jgi:cbb3-type cytochrome oxidase subunit 3
MLKWVLTAVGLVAVMIAVFIGVVWFLFARESPNTSRLTEDQSAEVLELLDTGSGYNVVYKYVYDGEIFNSSTSIQSRSMSVGSGFIVCVDPGDPAWHAQTKTNCGSDGPTNPH